jgi:hypothetical protein
MIRVEELCEVAAAASSGDAITNIMAKLSGEVNAELRNIGSKVMVNAHHIDRVSEQIATFLATKRGRLYIRTHFKKAVAEWVKQNAGLGADEVETRRKEIVSLLRDQLMDDKLTSIDKPLSEIEMVVGESGPHRRLHAAERVAGAT